MERDARIDQLRQALADFRPGSLFDHEAEEAKAAVRKRALLFLDARARSRHELRGRLLDLEFEEAVVDDVLDDLAGVGLLDDAAFAHEWVRQRHARRGKSSRVLDRELQDKGVDSATRADALEQIDAADEEATARALAEKKARSVRTVPADRAESDKALRRIVGVLARRGFAQGMSLRIARDALDERVAQLS
ncbi:regulatory protein [Corynebacterium pollutisoli]|uniref:Regulatory protein RecX n=1 Tax=Corynebacterium pollutisoli TaxID=1610489 RepID=A0A1X7IA47_9CORY|nr:recombination regulator RecX [Corynebacterium pollutisoli]NLP38167.1 recombination regulator RecX [Corynebacterium pollutisoli]SMG11579.1 regulatory protein [Corynebacterium pollutisoli]HJD78141.1 recombination regulator RecX [Corynebacterium pollutisoli]